jgi:ribonuclease P protein subunit RPR2
MGKRRDKNAERLLARRRVEGLLQLAEQESRAGGSRVARYVELARRLAMRYQTPLPAGWRRRVCRGCGALLTAGRNLRVRSRDGRRVQTCLDCGRVQRFPMTQRKVQ